jgi:hypothetical protein
MEVNGENIGKRGKVQAKMRTCGVEWATEEGGKPKHKTPGYKCIICINR